MSTQTSGMSAIGKGKTRLAWRSRSEQLNRRISPTGPFGFG
jgi:hypothetical protein